MPSAFTISLSVDDDLPSSSALGRLHLMAELSQAETEAFQQLPQEEALALLDLLVNRYGIVLKAAGAPMTEAERHRLDVGHPLAFGCCRSDVLVTSGESRRNADH
jgi:hypothetical protein